ncbi:hypothetical protein QLQ80_02700 [Mycoplasma sp. M5725]|uniref:Uncharacterized protein n=1 Tax=Mycoplasma phocimorsus TaxID=3045839 RepID=A0AAJ1UWZ2_9MOLU|nr:hypothetical protein [Mycoplasma phocimorsus]MDJ1645975.1 hypothetical protein [Mycoplasma phocimorsus]MDJ1646261.1 hypothetical protein [Mycoplasma phocimorsus]MDJ1648469.1 hypothetical protein [Mycoplasma phocimorsus]
MKKVALFVKNKIFWTFILLISVLSVFIGVLIFKMKNPYKPAFFNYSSYISKKNREEMEKTFTYKEFGTVIEFKNALEKEQAAAGILPASEAARLVKEDRIRKIDFNQVFNLKGERILKSTNEVKNFIQNIVTPITWRQLESYDEYLKNTLDKKKNKIEDRHLWEYFLPYYSQEYVIAYSSHKNGGKILEGVQDYELSWFEILSKLKELGYQNIAITNDLRNNIALGTTRLLSKNKADFFIENNGKLTKDDYVDQLDSFQKLIEESLDVKITQHDKVLFEPDGSNLLDKLIIKESNINLGILFNGDGLDAFYSEDNNKDVEEGSVRIIKPKQTVITLDGIIINNSVSDEEVGTYLQRLNTSLYSHEKYINYEDFNDYSLLEKKLEQHKIINEDGEEEIDYSAVNFASNFDFINYTPVYKIEYNYFLDNYFDDDEKGRLAFNIYKIDNNKAIFLQPIDKELDAQARIKFNNIVSN